MGVYAYVGGTCYQGRERYSIGHRNMVKNTLKNKGIFALCTVLLDKIYQYAILYKSYDFVPCYKHKIKKHEKDTNY